MAEPPVQEGSRQWIDAVLAVVLVALALMILGGMRLPAEAPSERRLAPAVRVQPLAADTVQVRREGVASYYGAELGGRPTASGETFDPARLTAAHRTLPFGTRVRVTNLRNGRAVVVRINDRGPFGARRIIDLSHAAAQRLGMLRLGTVRVRLDVLP